MQPLNKKRFSNESASTEEAFPENILTFNISQKKQDFI